MKDRNPIKDLLEMQVTKQVVRSVKTKRCLSAASSFSLAKQDVVLSALLSSLDLLFLLGQAKRKEEKPTPYPSREGICGEPCLPPC